MLTRHYILTFVVAGGLVIAAYYADRSFRAGWQFLTLLGSR